MIEFVTGDLLESNAAVLVNTVNTVGVMGKGIALQFKQRFPVNNKVYVQACKEGSLTIGKLLITEEKALYGGNKLIINFPTKTTWKKPSEYEYIALGLRELVKVIEEKKIKSVAIPPLGSGNGGLDWHKVKNLITEYLSAVDCHIYIYEPNAAIQEALNKERVKLTPARAMLLAVLFELVRNGEFVSEFAAEKIAYFLQRFGANDVFKLDFQPNFYGPYSGKVRHVLYYLNGSYITGYSAKDKKAFEELSLVMAAEEDVTAYLNSPENARYAEIVRQTKDFLSGFYSAFALELLSTVDYIMLHDGLTALTEIHERIKSWSDRKKTIFADQRFLEIAQNNLKKFNLVG
jgi:O-acetyl-ADP-ribose deacetylase (regulator of RNase III)